MKRNQLYDCSQKKSDVKLKLAFEFE